MLRLTLLLGVGGALRLSDAKNPLGKSIKTIAHTEARMDTHCSSNNLSFLQGAAEAVSQLASAANICYNTAPV